MQALSEAQLRHRWRCSHAFSSWKEAEAAEGVLDFRLQHNVGVAKKANEAAGKTANVATQLSADCAGSAHLTALA